MNNWFEKTSSLDTVVISSRIRIARNIKNYPFTNRMDKSHIDSINELIISAIKNNKSGLFDDFKVFNLNDDIQNHIWIDKNIITPDILNNNQNKILILSKDENISITICAEDHIRLNFISGGMDLDISYNILDKIDNALNEVIPFAYDDNLGYLTESLTNIGTGLKASLFLHLPGLKRLGEISSLKEYLSKIGLSIKNAFSEDTDFKSCVYELSNNVTLGITEIAALENLKSVAAQIIAKENNARYSLDRFSLEEEINEAMQKLLNAETLNYNEALSLLSEIKLGISLGIIENISSDIPFMLMINSRENILKSLKISKDDINIQRANYIRNNIK